VSSQLAASAGGTNVLVAIDDTDSFDSLDSLVLRVIVEAKHEVERGGLEPSKRRLFSVRISDRNHQ